MGALNDDIALIGDLIARRHAPRHTLHPPPAPPPFSHLLTRTALSLLVNQTKHPSSHSPSPIHHVLAVLVLDQTSGKVLATPPPSISPKR